MFRSYVLLNAEQEELLKYESFKLEVFKYIIIFLSCTGSIKIISWIRFILCKFNQIHRQGRLRSKSDKVVKNSKPSKKRNSPIEHEVLAEILEDDKPGTSRQKDIVNQYQYNSDLMQTSPEQPIDLSYARIPESPSPESIMGVAAAAATAATVFMDNKREKYCRRCKINK